LAVAIRLGVTLYRSIGTTAKIGVAHHEAKHEGRSGPRIKVYPKTLKTGGFGRVERKVAV